MTVSIPATLPLKPAASHPTIRLPMSSTRAQVFTSRNHAIAEVIEGLVKKAARTIDGAIYRFNNPRLAAALGEALLRGVKVRVILDRTKYAESQSSSRFPSEGTVPFRLLSGRPDAGGKMHHKFVVLDGKTLLTGSYNWTLESEEQNFENLIVLRDRESIAWYQREFATLWAEAAPVE